ncbi:MAG: hypothetical protein K940chlam9_00355 [Chlamydiae bacterium]|nr:hypothetical protein [Chlamydiota bacterium]
MVLDCLQGCVSSSCLSQENSSLSAKSKWALVAAVVGSVAGVVIMGLGGASILGGIGSAGFIGSLAGGGVLTLFSAGGIIAIAIASYKKEKTGGGFGADIGEQRAAYPNVGEDALSFAREKLAENSNVKKHPFSSRFRPSNTYQPENKAIGQLTTVFYACWNTFESVLKENQGDPWSQDAVVQVADDLMKISYAISCLTLEDLPKFTDALQDTGTHRTFGEALTKQDSYQYRTYYFCTRAYHNIRGGFIWGTVSQKVLLVEPLREALCAPTNTSPAYAELFYQNSTLQSQWRELYNDYCDRVRLYVHDKDMPDDRHKGWTQKDTKAQLFDPSPTFLPT